MATDYQLHFLYFSVVSISSTMTPNNHFYNQETTVTQNSEVRLCVCVCMRAHMHTKQCVCVHMKQSVCVYEICLTFALLIYSTEAPILSFKTIKIFQTLVCHFVNIECFMDRTCVFPKWNMRTCTVLRSCCVLGLRTQRHWGFLPLQQWNEQES